MSATLAAKLKNVFEIEWNKNKPFFAEKLFQSIEYLDFRKRNLSAITACETIEKIVAERQKYHLFRKFFSKEWKNSRASFFKTGYYENYSERINEFFQLVHEKLFPVLSGWNDDPEAELDNFFIFSFNIDLCCEEILYEHLRISYVFALIFYFRDDEIWAFLAENYKICREDFPEVNNLPHDNLWHCERRGKVALYVNLFEVIDHSTNNPWLDTMNCRGGDCFAWDEDTILFLTESYKESQRLLEQTVMLDEMIEANPQAVLLDLISLWNDGHLPGEEEKAAKKARKIKS
jgi:hypothetical protein